MIKIIRKTDSLNYKSTKYNIKHVAKNDIFADILLVVESEDGDVSKTIGIPLFKDHLAENLPYFEGLFRPGSKWKESEKIDGICTINLKNENPDIMAYYLKSIFDEEIAIHNFNCVEIYKCAKYFRDELLMVKTKQFIKNNLNYEILLKILQLEEFGSAIVEYIKMNPLIEINHQIVNTLLKLSEDQFKKLLSVLVAENMSRSIIFILMKWITSEMTDAKIVEIVKMVNFAKIEPEYTASFLGYLTMTMKNVTKIKSHVIQTPIDSEIFIKGLKGGKKILNNKIGFSIKESPRTRLSKFSIKDKSPKSKFLPELNDISVSSGFKFDPSNSTLGNFNFGKSSGAIPHNRKRLNSNPFQNLLPLKNSKTDK